MDRVKRFVKESWLEVRNACIVVFLAMVFFALFYFLGALFLAFFMGD
jgi:maltodextrin utilization protein YvdJ